MARIDSMTGSSAIATYDGPAQQWAFYGRPTAFVGRVKELHRLREAQRSVIESRRRRAVLLSGPPGIGKTRLLAEFCDTIEEHVDRVTVLQVACLPDGGPPYSLYQRLLKARFYVQRDASPDAARERIRAGLVQVLRDEALGEEAAHFIGHLVGLRYPRSKHILRVDADPRRVEERAVELFKQVLRTDALRTPLTVAVDNLHLASEESLSLLLKLAQGLDDAPVFFIGVARTTVSERQRFFFEGLRAAGEAIELQPLPDRDCRRILRSLLGGAEVPEPFVKLACEKAMGNPLSLEQIVQLQIERGAIEAEGDRWIVRADRLGDTRIPGTLRDVVRSKLARLGPTERRVLEKAAAVGDVFWSGCVEMLRRVDEGHTWDEADRFWNTPRRSEELLRVLEELRRRHILLRSPQSAFPRSREYTFKHTLEREVLYEGIEGPRRARYHRLIAQWLEARRDEGSGDALIEQIALHWERGHLPRKAAGYYVQAGDRAIERHVNAKADAFYRKALQCLGDDEAMVRLHVFHKLGKIRMVMGDHAEALGYFQEMLRLAWLLDDPRQGGLAYDKMGQSYRALGEYELALEHLKNALALFRRAEDVRGIAMCADDIGRVHLMRGELDLAEERFEEGLRLRRHLGDDRSVALSLHHLGNVHTERGDFRRAVKVHREALELARKAGDEKGVADILTSTGVICHQRGDYEKALTLWSEALEISRQLGERQLQGILQNNMGEACLTLGRVEEARERLDRAVAILEEVGDRRSLSDALRNQGCVHLQRGDYAAALESSRRALEVARDVGARGLAGLAERNLGEVFSRTLYDDEATREERTAAAARHFANAIRELSAVGLEAELGKALLARGAFLVEIGHEDEARGELERARELFARLDMKDGLERAERVLAAL